MSNNDHIIVTCPVCQETFDVPSNLQGKKIECQICLTQIAVPYQVHDDKTIDLESISKKVDSLTQTNIEEDIHLAPIVETFDEKDLSDTIQESDTVDETTSNEESENSSEQSIIYAKDSDKKHQDITQNETGDFHSEYDLNPPELQEKSRPIIPILFFIVGVILLGGAITAYIMGRSYIAKIGKSGDLTDTFYDKEFSRAGMTSKWTEEQITAMTNVMQKRAEKVQRTKELLESKEIISPKDVETMKVQLIQFASAKSPEERSNFVLNKQQAIKDMVKQELPVLPSNFNMRQILSVDALSPKLALFKLNIDDEVVQFLFVKDEASNQWLIDWYSLSGFSPSSYDELVKQRPSDPTDIRAIAIIGGTYTKQFPNTPSDQGYNKNSYINILLQFPDGNTINAYMDRLDPNSVDLVKSMFKGDVKVILSVFYPKDLKDNDSVIISNFKQLGWHSPETEQKLQEATKASVQE